VAPAGNYISISFSTTLEPNDRLFFLLPQSCSSISNTTSYFTGNNTEQTIIIKQNTLAVYFHTDATISTNSQGFKLTWSYFAPTASGATCINALGYGTLVRNCGNDLSGSSGAIQSPNYARAYNAGSYCNWNIQAPAGTAITLNITAFYTEPNCDFFHALRPQDCTSVIDRPYSGRLDPQLIYYQQNSASLFFRSDSVTGIQYSGFNISWFTTPTCVDSVRRNIQLDDKVSLLFACM
jgi:hypothetical protein